MQRANFHLTETQLDALRQLSERTGLPVAELVRRAVDSLLERERKRESRDAQRSAD